MGALRAPCGLRFVPSLPAKNHHEKTVKTP